MRARLIAIALLAASIAGLGGMAATTGANAQPGSTPDTYVNYWDTVGAQAFTASGLAAPEGFVIFANVDIAVYDSLMAIRGGYQPFAVDVEAPDGASAEAAVAAAARDTLVHYLPAQAATIIDPAYVNLAGDDSGRAGQGRRNRDRAGGCRDPDRSARRRRLPGGGHLHAAGSADPGRLDPDLAGTGRSAPTCSSCVRSATRQRASSGRPDRRRSRARAGHATTTR